MLVAVLVPLCAWAVQFAAPLSLYCTSYPLIAGLPVTSGAVQDTSSLLVGVAAFALTLGAAGAGGAVRQRRLP